MCSALWKFGLGIPLVRSMMKLGWHKGGRYFTTSPERSLRGAVSNLPALWGLGLLSPLAVRAVMKMLKMVRKRPESFSFASDSKVAEIDGEESVSDFMERIGVPQDMRLAFRGFLEVTMGELDEMGAAYAMT